ncbi:antibiotic biosynthesis monooxygenase family protein [Streptomyces sp. NPDC091279]|uniref:antibiotic biosynthesis monooxygenase family protein n=1 Tax=unclassified Streptomyces TaxID=2593676 RepID=UPI00382190EA
MAEQVELGETAITRKTGATVRMTDALIDQEVTMINAFTVPAEESELFLSMWRNNARAMAGQPGFVRARMHRALDDGAELRFVNVAEWATGADLARARKNPEWQAFVQRMLDEPGLHVVARPMVYEIVLDVRPGDEV